jgi:hypothetical protein
MHRFNASVHRLENLHGSWQTSTACGNLLRLVAQILMPAIAMTSWRCPRGRSLLTGVAVAAPESVLSLAACRAGSSSRQAYAAHDIDIATATGRLVCTDGSSEDRRPPSVLRCFPSGRANCMHVRRLPVAAKSQEAAAAAIGNAACHMPRLAAPATG